MIFAQELYYLLNIQWVEILGKTSIDLHFNVELWENLQFWILPLYNIIPFILLSPVPVFMEMKIILNLLNVFSFSISTKPTAERSYYKVY